MVVDAMPTTDTLSATLFALADPTRRAILARLATGDATVKELSEPYAMSVAAISKHLKVLEEAGLVSHSKDAQRRPRHIEVTPLREVAAWIDDYRAFWERSMDALDAHLEAMQRPKPAPREPHTKPSPRKKPSR
jgi:DNA-binding transcriptional ArsR family regulator